MYEEELRESIRSQVLSGRLPASSRRHTLLGIKGERVACACCGRLITDAQIQFEINFAGAVIVQMHPSCHDEWVEASIALASTL